MAQQQIELEIRNRSANEVHYNNNYYNINSLFVWPHMLMGRKISFLPDVHIEEWTLHVVLLPSDKMPPFVCL